METTLKEQDTPLEEVNPPKLHGCKIGNELKPGSKQKNWLIPELIHKAPKANFTGVPGVNPGVQLDHPNGGPLTWIKSPIKEACGVERVGNKWHWLIMTDDVGDVEGVRSYCLGTGELGCDGCGQEKNWQALNRLPDKERLAIQEKAISIEKFACIYLKRPWFTTLPAPKVKENKMKIVKSQFTSRFIIQNKCFQHWNCFFEDSSQIQEICELDSDAIVKFMLTGEVVNSLDTVIGKISTVENKLIFELNGHTEPILELSLKGGSAATVLQAFQRLVFEFICLNAIAFKEVT